MTYGIVGSYQVQGASIFGKVDVNHVTGLAIAPNPFLCCGVTSIHSFGRFALRSFAEKAEFLAGLFAVNNGRTHYMYVITESQAKMPGMEHALLLEIGSVKVCEFKSLQHSPWNLLQVFVCDINGAKGKYLNESGQALSEPRQPTPPRAQTVILTPAPVVEVPVAAPAVKKVSVKKEVA